MVSKKCGSSTTVATGYGKISQNHRISRMRTSLFTSSHFAGVLLLFNILVLDGVLGVHHHGDRDEAEGQDRVEGEGYPQYRDTQYRGDHQL